MRMLAISDNTDICTGLRLAGIQCIEARTQEELKKALSNVRDGGHEIGVVAVTKSLAEQGAELLAAFQNDSDSPLFVEI